MNFFIIFCCGLTLWVLLRAVSLGKLDFNVTAAVAAFFVGAWAAGTVAEMPYNAFESQTDIPPAEYRSDGLADVQFRQGTMMTGACEIGTVACYSRLRKRVYVSNPCQPHWMRDSYAVLLCHELGHTQGWLHKGGVNIQTVSGFLFRPPSR